MRMTTPKNDRLLLYRETFDSPKQVAGNGGVNSLCSVDKGATPTTTSAYIQHTKHCNLLSGANKATFVLRFRTASTALGAASRRLFDKANAALTNVQWIIQESNTQSRMMFHVANALNDFSNFITSSVTLALSTEYVVHIVYDGTLAAASRAKIYINGTLDASATVTGTIAAAMQFCTQAPSVFGLSAGQSPDSDFKMRSIEVYNAAFAQEEVTDSYQQDTISETDAKQSLVTLPLKSWYWKENGTNLLTNGDFATGDFTGWTIGTITQTIVPGSPNVAHLAYDGSHSTGGVSENVLVSGKRYKIISGMARGDGTAIPGIYNTGWAWTGTNSASWQDLAGVEFIAAGTDFRLWSSNQSAGTYVEYKNLRVELMEARTDNIGSLGSYAILGDGGTPATMPTFTAPHKMTLDGNKFLTIPNFNSGLLGNSGTAIIFVKLASAAAGTHVLMMLGESGTYMNGFLMNQNGALFSTYWKSAGGTVSVNNMFTPGVWQMLAMVNDGGNTSVIVDDLWTGPSASGGAISSSLNLNIGGAAAGFAGIVGDVMTPIVLPFALTPSQLRYVRRQFLKNLNV